MEEKREMCPLLGAWCIGANCAWGDVDGTCAMHTMAKALRTLDAKAIDADELLQVVERIAEQ